MPKQNNAPPPPSPQELLDLARLRGLDPAAYADAAALLDALAARPEETAGPEGGLESVADTLREVAMRLTREHAARGEKKTTDNNAG